MQLLNPFCSEHRLPEEHRCVKLSQIRAKRFGEKKIIRDGGRDRPNVFKDSLEDFRFSMGFIWRNFCTSSLID